MEMVEQWSTSNMSSSGEVEIDVSECFQTVTEDAITRTAFGRSYDDGKAVFQLQTQQMVVAAEAFRNVFIPGYRYLPVSVGQLFQSNLIVEICHLNNHFIL